MSRTYTLSSDEWVLLKSRVLEICMHGSERGVKLFYKAEYCGTPQSKERRNWEYKVCLNERALRLFDHNVTWKSGCFSAPERGDFSKNSEVLQLFLTSTISSGLILRWEILLESEKISFLFSAKPYDTPQGEFTVRCLTRDFSWREDRQFGINIIGIVCVRIIRFLWILDYN